jgi:3-mercaptopyruvate sulfurtransferase SseA
MVMKRGKTFTIFAFFAATAIFLLSGCGSSGGGGGGGGSISTTPYPNADLLVSGSSLQAMSATNRVIIDVRSASDYSAGHIPGAINIPMGWGGAPFDDSSYTSADWQYYQLQPAAASTYLGGKGVSNTNKIVVYGAKADNLVLSGRMFWMLEYLGATDVHILDGGYEKWVSDGHTTTTTATTLPATTFSYSLVSSRIATKAEVLAHYSNPSYAIVDSRNAADTGPTSVSTGWHLPFNTQHIPNAVNILITDFLNSDKTVKSYSDIKALLDGKGITSGKTVITNCYVGYRSSQEYFIFRLMGYDVSNYNGSWGDWNADVTYLPRETSLIVSTAWLNANRTNGNQVIIDVRSTGLYGAGHIPGAINIPMAWGGPPFDQSGSYTSSDWQYYELLPAATIASVLGSYGVSNTNTIVVYGANSDMLVLSGRMFWMLEYLGATDVRVLDGGYDKWASDGYTTTTAATTLAAATFTPSVFTARLATMADVLAHYADTTNYIIVDSRNGADFTTKHITNAISILHSDLLSGDNTVKSFSDLKTLLDGDGVTTGKKVITNCYVGYRSSQEYLVMRMMGFNVSNYDGSWWEWITDPLNPTAP